MPDTKKVLLLIPHMVGGGAERVAALLMNQFAASGYATEVAITADRAQDVVRRDLDGNTAVTLLPEILPADSVIQIIKFGVLLRIYAQVFCNLFELFRRPVPADLAKASLYVQYHREIAWLQEKLKAEPNTTVIAFLQPAIPITMLASRGLPNRVIFSERCDPAMLMKKRYGKKFIEKYYRRADAAVFQSGSARDGYPAEIAKKGVVIPNLLKSGLPEPFTGERSKRIVTFCRISYQKNLPLLIDAFALFRKKHPAYTLAVYGDAVNDDDKNAEQEVRVRIDSYGLQETVSLLPFSKNIHEEILKDAMYVNSSDYEGLSNAMIEAMAIGLPSVCTDCPAGGARAMILDGENGLLVPVRDPEQLSLAMCRVADDPALAQRLSENGVKLREELSAEKIAERWIALF